MNWLDIVSIPTVFLALALGIAGTVYGLSLKFANRKPAARPGLEQTIDKLMPYIRRLVFSAALLWSVWIFWRAAYGFAAQGPATTFMARWYALSALITLFIVLAVGLMRAYFPNFPLNRLLLQSSKGWGLSAFLFMSLHILCAFVGNLGGKLNAVVFLSTRHQLALVLSITAFLIFVMMVVTSLERIMAWLTFPRWKRLQRLIYLATLLVLFHAFLIGSHFSTVAAPLPLLIMLTALVLLLLEAGATFKKIRLNRSKYGEQRLRVYYALLVLLVGGALMASTYGLGISYNPHASHKVTYSSDYVVSVHALSPPIPGQSAALMLHVTQKSNGAPVDTFTIVNEKLMHLIVVSENLEHYRHLHPEHKGGGVFTTDFTPPAPARYYLYAEFAPRPAQEALATATLATTESAPADQPLSFMAGTDRETGGYKVKMSPLRNLKAQKDYQTVFTVTDSESGKPVKDLEAYLGAFGHLAIIHEDKQNYVHVHPLVGRTDASGPNIRFSANFPRSGRYKLFLQFQHKGEVRLIDFLVEVP